MCILKGQIVSVFKSVTATKEVRYVDGLGMKSHPNPAWEWGENSGSSYKEGRG